MNIPFDFTTSCEVLFRNLHGNSTHSSEHAMYVNCSVELARSQTFQVCSMLVWICEVHNVLSKVQCSTPWRSWIWSQGPTIYALDSSTWGDLRSTAPRILCVLPLPRSPLSIWYWFSPCRTKTIRVGSTWCLTTGNNIITKLCRDRISPSLF